MSKKQLTLKEKAEAIQAVADDIAFQNFSDSTIARLSHGSHEYSRSRAKIYLAFSVGPGLVCALHLAPIFDDAIAQKAFDPAATVADITATSANHKLAFFKRQAIEDLTPPTLIQAPQAEYKGNGVYVSPAIPEKKDSITAQQFNDKVTENLKSDFEEHSALSWATGIPSTFAAIFSISHLFSMRRDRKDIERVYDKYIDTSKVQPLVPERSGPGPHA